MPALFTHDQDLKRRPGPERVEEPSQPRPLLEFGAADPVVHEEVRVRDDPAVCQRIGPGMVDLPGYRPLLVRHLDLFRRLPGIDGGHQRTGNCQGAGTRPTRPRTHVEISSGPGAHGGVTTSRTKAAVSASTTAVRTASGQNSEGTNVTGRALYRAGTCHAPSGPRTMAEPTT